MKVVNPDNVNHTIDLIPRSYVTPVILELYNEVTKVNTEVSNISTLSDGILSLNFDFSFSENDKYQIKVSNGTEILYRGKLIATTQNPQKYKLTKDLYFYE